MLYCTVLYNILRHAMLECTIPYDTVLYYTRTLLCNIEAANLFDLVEAQTFGLLVEGQLFEFVFESTGGYVLSLVVA